MYQEIMYVLCSMVLSPLGGRTLGQRRRNAPRSRRRKRRWPAMPESHPKPSGVNKSKRNRDKIRVYFLFFCV